MRGIKKGRNQQNKTMNKRTRFYVWDRDDGRCQFKFPDGQRCLAPASQVHHIKAKKMGGRKGKGKEEIERIENYECRCIKHHLWTYIDGKYYMGHKED